MHIIFGRQVMIYAYCIYTQVLRVQCCWRDDIINDVVECVCGVVVVDYHRNRVIPVPTRRAIAMHIINNISLVITYPR